MASTVGPSATIVAPSLAGVWLHSVDDPEGSETNSINQTGERGEAIDVQATMLQFIGRVFPVAEYGDQEAQAMSLGVKVPYDAMHDATIEAFRGYKRGRKTLCYRDNRARLIYGVIDGSLGVSDSADGGSTIGVKITRVDYTIGL